MNCVCVSRARVHACVISIVSPPVSTDAVEAGMHAFKPHSISLQIKNYRESAISAIRAERESVVAPSRSPLVFSASSSLAKFGTSHTLPEPALAVSGRLVTSSRVATMLTSRPSAAHGAVAPRVA